MTRSKIIETVALILHGPMANAHMAGFGPQTRLNEDLHLDSVLILNLLLHLEVSHGFDVPEREFSKDSFSSVEDLARFIAGEDLLPETPSTDAEEEIDIKVHCFVSCLCAAIKAREKLDHRPFYFGVWDTDFHVDEAFQLSYHGPSVKHDHFRHWFRRLYGVNVIGWYNQSDSKAANLATFERLLDEKRDTEHLMVMLDLYHLPERENKFNQNPFPHYVMIDKTEDENIWFMHDPDYRWEGRLEKTAILNAIAQPSVAGGYIFDRAEARPPKPEDLRGYFQAGFNGACNPLTNSVRQIIRAHIDPETSPGLPALDRALRELPVIAIRKYAYEHGFAFFWRTLGLSEQSFEAWCDEIEKLHQGFRTLQYKIVKLSATEDPDIATRIFADLDALDKRELHIKSGLKAWFTQWHEAAFATPNRALEKAGMD